MDALLRDLGARLGEPRERGGHQPTGLPDIDHLLGGGIPLGALCEISGPASSGRTSLTLALLAQTTRAGALVGLVDAVDAFDPISAEQAGVDLDRVLWVRARTVREALGSTERLIQTEGFPLVVFDWSVHSGERIPTAAWLRLTRLAAASRTAFLVLSNERLAGSHADIALSMEAAQAHFTGTPALLEEFETRAVLVRHRRGAIDRSVSVSLSSSASTLSSSPASTPTSSPSSTRTPHESAA
jgi:recombination protein RecA